MQTFHFGDNLDVMSAYPMPGGIWVLNTNSQFTKGGKTNPIVLRHGEVHKLPVGHVHFREYTRHRNLKTICRVFHTIDCLAQGRKTYIDGNGNLCNKKDAILSSLCVPNKDYYSVNCNPPLRQEHLDDPHRNIYSQTLREFAIMSSTGLPLDKPSVIFVHIPTRRVIGLQFDRHYDNFIPSTDGMTFLSYCKDINKDGIILSSDVIIIDNPLM